MGLGPASLLPQSANGFPSLGLPFVSLTDVRATRINLFPSSISSPSEEKYGALGCRVGLGQSGVDVLPQSNSTNKEKKTLEL